MNGFAPLGLAAVLALAIGPAVIDTSEAFQVLKFGVGVLEASNPDSAPPAPQFKPAPERLDGVASPDARAKLQRVLPRLAGLFRYRRYRIVAELRGAGPIGVQQQFVIPGNRSLNITPEILVQNRVQMRVVLRESGRVGLLTGILVSPGIPTVLGGPAYGEGVLIIVLWTDPPAPSPTDLVPPRPR